MKAAANYACRSLVIAKLSKKNMDYIAYQTLLALAKNKPPKTSTCTVSSFSGWIFSLYASSSPESVKYGKSAEFEIEREARNRLVKQPPPLSPEFELVFADPLDRSCPPFRISSLTVNGNPIYGIPDVVYRNKTTGEVVIIERKVTRAKPNEWPNLKAQLWCYSKIDDWKDAPKIRLLGNIYDPKYDLKYSKHVGPWQPDKGSFETECRQLFELFGGSTAN